MLDLNSIKVGQNHFVSQAFSVAKFEPIRQQRIRTTVTTEQKQTINNLLRELNFSGQPDYFYRYEWEPEEYGTRKVHDYGITIRAPIQDNRGQITGYDYKSYARPDYIRSGAFNFETNEQEFLDFIATHELIHRNLRGAFSREWNELYAEIAGARYNLRLGTLTAIAYATMELRGYSLPDLRLLIEAITKSTAMTLGDLVYL